MSDTIKICTRHDKQVPLLWTMVFVGAEYWCPYCGANEGMLGAGENIPSTPELEQAHKDWKESTEEYLDANATFVCSSMEWEGETISPNDLPESEKERCRKVIEDWVYESEKEDA